MDLGDLLGEGEKVFKQRHNHSDVAFYFAKTLQVLEKVSANQNNPTHAVLAANALHKKIINYTLALVWEVPDLILQTGKAIEKIIDLLDVDEYCQKCGQAFANHNDDGSCIED